MIIENIVCIDSALCQTELFATNPNIVAILHLPNKHIIHTKEDYDESMQLKPEICTQLADVGILHLHTKMTEDKIVQLMNRTNFINNALKKTLGDNSI